MRQKLVSLDKREIATIERAGRVEVSDGERRDGGGDELSEVRRPPMRTPSEPRSAWPARAPRFCLPLPQRSRSQTRHKAREERPGSAVAR